MKTLRSEWRKLTSVRMWLGLSVAAILFSAVNAGALIAFAGSDVEGVPMPELGGADGLRMVYATAAQAAVFAMILGILAITGEYRHQTITATLLATPRRGRLLAAKMAASAILGAGIGLASMLVILLALWAASLFRDGIGPIDLGEFAGAAGATLLGFAVYAVLGVGFGSLVRNQIAALTVALIWVLLAESLIVTFWPGVGKWLPGGALNGVLRIESFTGSGYLDVAPAALLLLAYGVVLAAVAAATTMRRDIT